MAGPLQRPPGAAASAGSVAECDAGCAEETQLDAPPAAAAPIDSAAAALIDSAASAPGLATSAPGLATLARSDPEVVRSGSGAPPVSGSTVAGIEADAGCSADAPSAVAEDGGADGSGGGAVGTAPAGRVWPEGADQTITEGADQTITEGADQTITEGADQTITEGADQTITEEADDEDADWVLNGWQEPDEATETGWAARLAKAKQEKARLKPAPRCFNACWVRTYDRVHALLPPQCKPRIPS
jgi:hypothetical protein